MIGWRVYGSFAVHSRSDVGRPDRFIPPLVVDVKVEVHLVHDTNRNLLRPDCRHVEGVPAGARYDFYCIPSDGTILPVQAKSRVTRVSRWHMEYKAQLHGSGAKIHSTPLPDHKPFIAISLSITFDPQEMKTCKISDLSMNKTHYNIQYIK